MRIFKFGGASVKDVDAVKNVARVLQHEGTANTLVVISAMGKMTNKFEDIIDAYIFKKDSLIEEINFAKNFHKEIIEGLFTNTENVTDTVSDLFDKLNQFMSGNTVTDRSFIYDQIIGYGELLSTTLVSAYLQEIGITNTWLDVRELIKTDDFYRDAKVNWELTQKNISEKVNTATLNITQGFLGSNDNQETTSLGREGSDYTAGIFAYCLEANNVTIWKDVEGVLNADPRVFTETELLQKISYEEAIEMAFYGASVIHPKTIQPLEQKQIPLFVRSFDDLEKPGTRVSHGSGIYPVVPCFIVKKKQILVSISAKDFSFMVEENISEVFRKLHEYKLKVNLIQNSAISFSVCVEDKYKNFTKFKNDLKGFFSIKSYENATLYTIKHFDNAAIESIKQKGKSLIRQINTETAQLVIQE